MFRNVETPLEYRMVPISRKFMTDEEDKKQYYISTVSTVAQEGEDEKPDLLLVHGCKQFIPFPEGMGCDCHYAFSFSVKMPPTPFYEGWAVRPISPESHVLTTMFFFFRGRCQRYLGPQH